MTSAACGRDEGGYGYEYAGALPPSNWGVNFDGSNFIEPEAYVNGGLVDEPSMDGLTPKP